MPITNRVWPLVIVGKGSSAAYYLCTVDTRDYPAILAIGDGDAWSAAVRGHRGSKDDPTLYINHPLHLITHFNKTIPGFSEQKVDRLEWAERNRTVFTECGVHLHHAKVKMISETLSFPTTLSVEDNSISGGYEIQLDDSTKIYAYKVVIAAGAGGHRAPDKEVESAIKKWPRQVIDLDQFARLDQGSLNSDISIIVMGPNAAIDAVQKALHYRCKIYWLLKPNEKPPILATQPMVQTAWDNNKDMIQRYNSFHFRDNKMDQKKVYIRLDNGTVLSGNYFVYGMGQTGETVNVINNNIQMKLTPIYDKNQYLGAGPNTILGFETLGTNLKSGFEVIGAMSAQVGRAFLNSKQESMRYIKDCIKEVRKIQNIVQSIQSAGFLTKPFLSRGVAFIGAQKREFLMKKLQEEVDFILKHNSNSNSNSNSNQELKRGLDVLVNLILAYQAAQNLDRISMQSQLNQVTHDLPKGTVADSGQLTSIRSAMAAKHNTVPKYAGSQNYEGNADKKSKQWVWVQSKPGDINFSVDNATVMQIALSVRYPFISGKFFNQWVVELMQKRHQTGTGFNDQEVNDFHNKLKKENDRMFFQSLRQI